MEAFFDINHIFFTFIGYPMSYIEFFGTILNILSVWLVARNKILNWPIGILGTVLFGILFWQIRLYSDFIEQIYFLITAFWGWYAWSAIKKDSGTKADIGLLSLRQKISWVIVIALGTAALGHLVSHFHIYFPVYFPAPASYAYLDAFTTVLSFVATFLLIRKKLEAWYLWIIVDIIGIWLYWIKGVHFISLLYVLFLIMATQGLFIWLKMRHATIKN